MCLQDCSVQLPSRMNNYTIKNMRHRFCLMCSSEAYAQIDSQHELGLQQLSNACGPAWQMLCIVLIATYELLQAFSAE